MDDYPLLIDRVLLGLRKKQGVGMGRTQFENLRVYQLTEELSDLCWKIVGMWESFAQMTVGRQLVTAADSVGANIAALECLHEFNRQTEQ